MGIIERFNELHTEISEWRQDIHSNPELLFDVHRTAAMVAEKLREFGVDEVVEGIGRTGVVGVIKGRVAGDKAIGLRADMDALPIEETTNLPYSSKINGKMHACGHDGHTAMLLGAAKYMSETRNFAGNVVVIFQPAEEGGAGGLEMVEDGMMERFNISQVYGMHNMPGHPVGHFCVRPGPLMAATDTFDIIIEGSGGHAAMPHEAIDSTVVGSHLVLALQSIVSRNVDPLKSAVVSVTTFHTEGNAYNVLPQTAKLTGTVRTLEPDVREQVEKRIRALVKSTAEAFGAEAELRYVPGYPMTVNSPMETAFAVDVATSVVGQDKVNPDTPPVMGGEDFSYMLEARPGAFVFVGNGDSASLHNPAYDFNDDLIPVGCTYWVELAEQSLPLS